jgi:hypothetical protein
MRSSSLYATITIAATMMDSCIASRANEFRRTSFGGRLPFARRISSSPSENDFIHPSSAFHHPQSHDNDVPMTVPAILENRCNNFSMEQNDREARYAVQYDHELQTIHSTDHAYLRHDEELPVIPASSHVMKIIPRSGPLNGQVWDL